MIFDANVPLYAVDESSPFHKPSLAWLEGALNGPARVGRFPGLIWHSPLIAAGSSV
ncbi:hypothetical protein IMZ11_07785 [Microtetraspora sp. AC03309]|uniref:hypothetical protein n=1 Tax=Microtetraspora sp. AC03309 TaxID=2779376 RepID=UPI001E548D38|nr:hypothetical protein [Microtetraspora sp. AC03309]MCC5575540.1 hypothetical protein [Microtetraspora sp. AC03309]